MQLSKKKRKIIKLEKAGEKLNGICEIYKFHEIEKLWKVAKKFIVPGSLKFHRNCMENGAKLLYKMHSHLDMT